MLKKNLVKAISIILLGGIVMMSVLSACGSSVEEEAPVSSLPGTTTSLPEEKASGLTPEVSKDDGYVHAEETTVSSTASLDSEADILELGKLIYDKTAGTVGCASCHGLDGKGGGAGPDIRGVAETVIRDAVKGGVPAMSFIKLDESEIQAVSAYVNVISQ